MNNKSTWGAFIGTLGSSFLATLCCMGPLLVPILGAGAAWSYIAFLPHTVHILLLLWRYHLPIRSISYILNLLPAG